MGQVAFKKSRRLDFRRWKGNGLGRQTDEVSRMRTKSPCLGCESRELGCHAYCEDYQDFRTANETTNNLIRKKKEQESKYLIEPTEFRLSKKRKFKSQVFKQTRK